MGLSVDRGWLGAEAVHQAVQALVQDAGGGRRGGQIPGGALEQVGARVLDPGRLGAGQRVAADKAGSSWAATTARLVEPTSVTTQSSGAVASASPTTADSSPTGTPTNTACAPATVSAIEPPASSST